MTDYYTCSHGADSLTCTTCVSEDAVREQRHQRRKASREVRWFAVNTHGRTRLDAHHEAEAVRLAKAITYGTLIRVVKEVRETIWDKDHDQ